MDIETIFKIFMFALSIFAVLSIPLALKDPDKDTMLDKLFSGIFH